SAPVPSHSAPTSFTTTRAPSRANSNASPRPIPRPPPVITATLPSSVPTAMTSLRRDPPIETEQEPDDTRVAPGRTGHVGSLLTGCSAGRGRSFAVIDVARQAVEAARGAGASYADARVVSEEGESLTVRNQEMEGVDRSFSQGLGIRVLVDGYWGF